MKIQQENEVPIHKRKKGKKLFVIEKRLTLEGGERRRKQTESEIQKEMKWSNCWTKYEKRKHVEQALADINKKKENALSWQDYLKDYEFRIVEDSNNEI